MRLISTIFILLACLSLQVVADDRTTDKLKQALASDIRSSEEKQRDANRKPIETLDFIGLRDDMKVLELFPGTGWYTKLLGPVLRDRGMLYVALMTSRLEPVIEASPILDKVRLLEVNPEMPMTAVRGIFELGNLSFFIEDLDMVVTFRNAHNLTAEGRGNLNEAVFDALKPGGVYAVIDHTRRHMEPLNKDNYRRSDPVAIIKECLDAGFEFEAYSDLHRREVDDLTLEVGDKAVTGQTDRFSFVFRKPL